MMKCKSCGIVIDEDEYNAFGGRCVTCYEESQNIQEEMDFEER